MCDRGYVAESLLARLTASPRSASVLTFHLDFMKPITHLGDQHTLISVQGSREESTGELEARSLLQGGNTWRY
jgi:hypothetical protein